MPRVECRAAPGSFVRRFVEIKPMKLEEQIEAVVKLLAERGAKMSADEALKFTQAVLNLAHSQKVLLDAGLLK
jgi:polyhydroxyalkanoate synthesis regulator phasin